MKIVCFALLALASAMAQDLRLGIIGTDTSHAGAFTKTLNDLGNPGFQRRQLRY
jgi:hypothetical protein